MRKSFMSPSKQEKFKSRVRVLLRKERGILKFKATLKHYCLTSEPEFSLKTAIKNDQKHATIPPDFFVIAHEFLPFDGFGVVGSLHCFAGFQGLVSVATR